MIDKNEFIEYCEVHTNMYGTAKTQITNIQNAKKIPLLDIDVQGAIKFEKAFPDSNFIAVVPPSVDSLRERLQRRGTETEKAMATRLANAPGELDLMLKLRNTFQFRVINENLELSRKTFAVLIDSLYSQELRGIPILTNVPKQIQTSSQPLLKTIGLIAGLVIVHEIWRYSRKA